MDIITERQLETAVEIAHSLFERGKVRDRKSVV